MRSPWPRMRSVRSRSVGMARFQMRVRRPRTSTSSISNDAPGAVSRASTSGIDTAGSAAEDIRPTLLDAALVRGTCVDPVQELRQAGELVETVEQTARLDRKREVDVGRGERAADEELVRAELAVQIAEVVL